MFGLPNAKKLDNDQLRDFLDELVERYNVPSFIEHDPLSVPKRFSKKQDQEISGFFTATFAWGLRKTIINKSLELMSLMDDSPHDFILNATAADLKSLLHFKHRTFQTTDLLFFIEFLKSHYQKHDSLEQAFSRHMSADVDSLELGLIGFHNDLFAVDFAPGRSKKHVATPVRKSTCKRLNMMMRWFVRKDEQPVDMGIWTKIKPNQLYLPLDVHVDRIAREMNLIDRKQTDWLTVRELTERCRQMDPDDPGKYDFALFGYGLERKYGYR